MNRYKVAAQSSKALALAVSIIAAKYVNDWIVSQKLDYSIAVLAIVVAVTSASYVVALLFDLVFDSSVVIRRILLGRMHVEGTWLVIVRQQGHVLATAVVHIGVIDYGLTVSGANYDANGVAASTFKGDFVRLDWPVLQFKHSTQPSEGEARLEGYGEVQFIERAGAPKQYQGFFMSLGDGQRCSIAGTKAEDAELLRRLDDPAHRRTEIMRLTQEQPAPESDNGAAVR